MEKTHQSADEQSKRRMQIPINTITYMNTSTSMMHANARNQRRELDSFSYIFIGCRCVFFRASILFMIVIFVFCIFSFEINKIEMERRLAKRRRCADVC